jgi:hypothetical protein
MSSSSETLLDHIADFLEFISSAQSFWFSLNTSYGHGCHLASRFRLDPNEYEALFIVAGLASYTRFGFQIKADAWRKFLDGRRLVALPAASGKRDRRLVAPTTTTPPSLTTTATTMPGRGGGLLLVAIRRRTPEPNPRAGGRTTAITLGGGRRQCAS